MSENDNQEDIAAINPLKKLNIDYNITMPRRGKMLKKSNTLEILESGLYSTKSNNNSKINRPSLSLLTRKPSNVIIGE